MHLDYRRARGLALLVSLVVLAFSAAARAQTAEATPASTIGAASLISPTAAASYYASLPTATTVTNQLWQSGRPAELVELSRSLNGDPNLIFEFVRNNVSNVWLFGAQKGPLGAIVDRSGTAFDQAMLMVELIRQGGGTANYQFGTITLTPAQFQAWAGTTNATSACQLLANGGIPAIINGTTTPDCSYGAAALSSITLSHVWVQAVVGGTTYTFDPAFKAYNFNATAANLLAQNGFTTNRWLPLATTGMTSNTASNVPFVSNLNGAALTSALTSTGTALQSWIETNYPANLVEDLVGGAHIIPLVNQPDVTSLPYVTGTPTTWACSDAHKGCIPDAYRTTLTVQVTRTSSANLVTPTMLLFNQPLFVDEIYARKLMVFSRAQGGGGSGVDTLALVDEFGAIKTIVSGPPTSDSPSLNDAIVALTANHPYAASATQAGVTDGTYMDATVTKHAVMWMPLLILNSWGEVDKRIVDKWGALDDTVAPFQQSPGCETCNLYLPSTGDSRRQQLGAAWMAQSAYAARMHAALAGAIYVQHHSLGVVAGDTRILTVSNDPSNPNIDQSYSVQDNFDRLDIDTAFSLTSKTAEPNSRRAAILAIAETLDGLEGSVASQISDLPDTTSTAVRLAWGNAPPLSEDAIGGGVSRKVYEYANATAASQAVNLMRFEGAVQASGANTHGATVPIINSSESTSWEAVLDSAIVDYANAGFDVMASEESFLGPGQRAGAFIQLTPPAQTYTHTSTFQRGGALVATKYSGLDPVQIAHVTVGLADRAKGGGGGAQAGHQAQYDPSKAADVLKAQFVDHSSALGVDLLHGSVTYTSPASLSIGQGDFPAKLDAQVIWRGGQFTSATFGPVQHTSPAAPWTSNWNNTLTVSGSGIQAMGDTDSRTAAGTITAFLALQDIYANAPSAQREVTAGLVDAWWVNTQLAGNVVTVNVGAGTQQFVHRVNGDWLSPGPGSAATLTQTGTRTPYTLDCGRTNTWVPTRGWDYSSMSFDVRGANGDVQHFAYWHNEVATGSVCSDLHGFRLTTWNFPQGVNINVNYASVTGDADVLSEVHNNLGRKITFINGGVAETGKAGGFNNSLTGDDLRSVGISSDGLTHTDPDGFMTRFVTHIFGQQYRLDQVFAADDTANPSLSYTYDTMNRVMTAKDRLAGLGLRPAYQFYIGEELRGARQDPLGQFYAVYYDLKQHPLRFVDERNETTLATYDGRGRVTAYTYPELNQETFQYDNHNNTTVLTKVPKPSIGGASILTQATWDQTWNKPLDIIDPKGAETDFTYGAAGTAGASLMLTAVRPAALAGQARPTYSFTYNTLGQLLTSTDPMGLVVSNAYDSSATNPTNYLLSTTVDPTGVDAVTAFTNDAQGDATAVDGPRMDVLDVSTTAYDFMRRKVLETAADPGNGVAPFATHTTYDAVGRIRLTENGSVSGTVFTPLHQTAVTYDPGGNKTAEVVSAGATVISATNYTYDALNRVSCAAVRMNPDTFTAGLDGCTLGAEGLNGPDRITHTLYNQVGQPTEVDIGYGSPLATVFEILTYSDNGMKATLADANNNITQFVYDAFDRLQRVNYPQPARSSGRINTGDFELYGYDPNSNITSHRKRSGGTSITYIYDKLNRQTTKTVPPPLAGPAPSTGDSVFSTYDLSGRLTGAHLGSLAGPGITYLYDTAGRLTQETSFGRTVISAYDLAGNRTQVTWPDGFFVTYSYDADNRVSQILENGVATGTSVLANFAYGPLDERASLTRGNGTAATYAYDPLARLTGLTQGAVTGANSAPSIQTLGYNPASQLLTLTQATAGYVWTGQAALATQATVADGLNRDMRLTALPSGGYDLNGNLIDDGTRQFTYDIQNRLTSVTGGSAPITITYDPSDRIQQTVTGPAGSTATTQFLYDGDRLIAEYGDSSNTPLRRYVHGVGTDEPLVWYEGSATNDTTRRWLHADHQGSIIGWSNSSGLMGETYTYGPYGEPQSWSGSRFRYTGQIALFEAQLYDYKARAYDPNMGHFLQTDPIGQQDDPNLYAYVKDDPTDLSDPTGTTCTGTLLCDSAGGEHVDRFSPGASQNGPGSLPNLAHSFKALVQSVAAAAPVVGNAILAQTNDFLNSAEKIANNTGGVGDLVNVVAGATIPVGGEGEIVNVADIAVSKAINSNIPHAIEQGVARGIFADARAAGAGLRDLSSQITNAGRFPLGALRDSARADRILVPVGKGGYAVYQVAPNGTARLKTVLIAR
jgi:RHS repeat-associated protein